MQPDKLQIIMSKAVVHFKTYSLSMADYKFVFIKRLEANPQMQTSAKNKRLEDTNYGCA